MGKQYLIRTFEKIAERRGVSFDGLYYSDNDKVSGKAFGYDFLDGTYICLGGFTVAKRGYVMVDAV